MSASRKRRVRKLKDIAAALRFSERDFEAIVKKG